MSAVLSELIQPLNLIQPFAHQTPAENAVFKSCNADFKVTEVLDVVTLDDGEHAYFYIESSGDNTQWVANQLAAFFGCRPVDVGFCGLKDRNAVTRQWFSVYDPQQHINPEKTDALKKAGVLQREGGSSHIIKMTRGKAKLRRGIHAGNQFEIVLRFDTAPSQALKQRLACIKEQGVPNYFGLQRFGREGNNLVQFQRWLENSQDNSNAGSKKDNKKDSKENSKSRRRPRKPQGIVLSAARSYLFNRVLAKRIRDGCWQTPMEGENSTANASATGPLWGRGRSIVSADALILEHEALAPFLPWCEALEHLGLKQERRALVCRPADFEWCFLESGLQGNEQAALQLRFFLPPGQYATSVLREVANITEPERTRC